MAVFRAFKPEAMNKIAKAMGYTGDMGQFQSYIEQDPMRQQPKLLSANVSPIETTPNQLRTKRRNREGKLPKLSKTRL